MAAKYAKDQPAGFTNRIERVAIVGAGGSVGKYIAEELLKTGKHTITALSRPGSTSKIPEGIRTVTVDYDDEVSLVAALKDQQVLIITMSVRAPPDTHHRLVVAAARAGVPYVMPNCFSWVIPNDRVRREAVVAEGPAAAIRDIEAQGVSAWIALASSFWYEYSLSGGYTRSGPDLYGFDFASRTVTFFDNEDGTLSKINTSTWRQCGRAVAALLSLKGLPEDENDTGPTVSKWRNQPLRISSFFISQRDMLDSVHRVLGTTDADWKILQEPIVERYNKAIEAMKAGDRSAYGRAMYSRIFFADAAAEELHYASAAGVANEELGLPKEDLDEATRRGIDMAEGR
ncbi:hypothetical protein QBC47DRAFT_354046 [Echria macrotheca]|uniref:NAD(P)-binding domain-containing protein n=1 Tax=Echria macrotheca TaxID=438768 RepID=A0AAJ0B243_9PEZI|nr:hypothetical protein QBC47DRAFT_354046 [Echria macrotheca]